MIWATTTAKYSSLEVRVYFTIVTWRTFIIAVRKWKLFRKWLPKIYKTKFAPNNSIHSFSFFTIFLKFSFDWYWRLLESIEDWPSLSFKHKIYLSKFVKIRTIEIIIIIYKNSSILYVSYTNPNMEIKISIQHYAKNTSYVLTVIHYNENIKPCKFECT